MPKVFEWAKLIIAVLVGATLVVVVQKASGLSAAPDKELSFAEFTGIILSALGVILTALALFLGVIAIVGWSSFEGLMQRKSDDFLEKRFSPSDPRYAELISEIKEDVRRELNVKSEATAEPIENLSPFGEDAV